MTNWLKDNLCGWLHLEEYLMGKSIFINVTILFLNIFLSTFSFIFLATC
jgi:hypothetical protein